MILCPASRPAAPFVLCAGVALLEVEVAGAEVDDEGAEVNVEGAAEELGLALELELALALEVALDDEESTMTPPAIAGGVVLSVVFAAAAAYALRVSSEDLLHISTSYLHRRTQLLCLEPALEKLTVD